MYEIGQLYAAGALKVACVALQCVGFNHQTYRAILEQANKYAQSSKWKTVGPHASSAGALGPGTVWNAGAGEIISGINNLSIAGGRTGEGSENNNPGTIGRGKK